jgi:hypothetical protein
MMTWWSEILSSARVVSGFETSLFAVILGIEVWLVLCNLAHSGCACRRRVVTSQLALALMYWPGVIPVWRRKRWVK